MVKIKQFACYPLYALMMLCLGLTWLFAIVLTLLNPKYADFTRRLAFMLTHKS